MVVEYHRGYSTVVENIMIYSIKHYNVGYIIIGFIRIIYSKVCSFSHSLNNNKLNTTSDKNVEMH